jgi:hypothetical protein
LNAASGESSGSAGKPVAAVLAAESLGTPLPLKSPAMGTSTDGAFYAKLIGAKVNATRLSGRNPDKGAQNLHGIDNYSAAAEIF